MDYRRSRNEDHSSGDSPTYSRLFVVCERKVSEDQIRKEFEKFGYIEDIRIPRDHKTGDPKGVVYVKFSKTSEAAAALEAMNNKVLPETNRPLKVMVASSRSDIQTDDHDTLKFKRLFLNIPKNMDESALQLEFEKFGSVDAILVMRDWNTGDPKGFAYVTYRRFSEAARAFEECERRYRAIFASPKGSNKRSETSFESNINTLASSSSNMKTSLISMMHSTPRGFSKVNFMCCPYLNQFQVKMLFDIVPGLVSCHYVVDLIRNFGKGTASYSNPVSASYAVEKLNKFEYPPGMKIFVKPDNSKFDSHEQNFSNIPNAVKNLKNAISSTEHTSSPDLAQLAEAIAEASKLIKMATAGVSDGNIPDSNDLNYCSAKLPSPKPLADIDSPVAKRCFLVCKPQPPPLTVLRDVFCRFGDLINVYTLPNKTVGYARFATVEAATEAINTLHGAEICGVRMKVLEADERPDSDETSNKRMRFDC